MSSTPNLSTLIQSRGDSCEDLERPHPSLHEHYPIIRCKLEATFDGFAERPSQYGYTRSSILEDFSIFSVYPTDHGKMLMNRWKMLYDIIRLGLITAVHF